MRKSLFLFFVSIWIIPLFSCVDSNNPTSAPHSIDTLFVVQKDTLVVKDTIIITDSTVSNGRIIGYNGTISSSMIHRYPTSMPNDSVTEIVIKFPSHPTWNNNWTGSIQFKTVYFPYVPDSSFSGWWDITDNTYGWTQDSLLIHVNQDWLAIGDLYRITIFDPQ